MSNEIPWPTPQEHFYIVSKIGNLNYVLTADDSGNMAMRPFDGTIEQLWKAQDSGRGGAYLQLVKSGLCLAGNRDTRILKMMALDIHTSDQLWRVENLGNPWAGINCSGDWELKINVYGSDLNGRIGLYGWDGGHDNEKWLIQKENGQVTVDSIQYDLGSAASDLIGHPPSHCTEIVIDNSGGGTLVTNTYELERSVTKTRSFTKSESETTSQKYTQTYTVSGGFDKIVEVSASGSFEESHSSTMSWSSEMKDSKTDTDKLSTQVSVPPGKKYSCHIIVYYGKVTVPYTAHLTFHPSIPGTSPVPFTSTGVFTGVNSTRYEIVIKDVTSPQTTQHFEVERRPVSKALAA